jgi:hypothetical protein
MMWLKLGHLLSAPAISSIGLLEYVGARDWRDFANLAVQTGSVNPAGLLFDSPSGTSETRASERRERR